MASPVDADRAATSVSTAVASPQNINLPGSISAGDLLVMLIRTPGAVSITTPSGWTALVNNNTSDASDDTTSIYYKKATGSEGATQSVAFSGSTKVAAVVWRITGAEDPATQAPEVSTTATGTSTVPDPTTVTPTGGSKDYLFLWLGGWEGEQTSPPSSDMTNYVNETGASTGTGGAVTTNCGVGGASRQLTASSENPPVWAISVSDNWSAWAVAIHPPAPPAATDPRGAYAEAKIFDAAGPRATLLSRGR